MKNVIKTTAAVIALSAVLAGPASAMVSKDQLVNGVYAALGTGTNITVTERNGVVTLSGYFSDAGDQAAAINAAERTEGVKKVINLAFPSS